MARFGRKDGITGMETHQMCQQYVSISYGLTSYVRMDITIPIYKLNILFSVIVVIHFTV